MQTVVDLTVFGRHGQNLMVQCNNNNAADERVGAALRRNLLVRGGFSPTGDTSPVVVALTLRPNIKDTTVLRAMAKAIEAITPNCRVNVMSS